MAPLNKLPIACVTGLAIFMGACGEEPKKPPGEPAPQPPAQQFTPVAPAFLEDSAYVFLKAQVDFGPRVPNTKEHQACGDFLRDKLKSYGLEVTEQKGEVEAFNKKKLHIRNITGRWNTKAANRVLLFAHWDTRPYADRDSKDRSKPILGANDGASGVAVLLEIARQLHTAGTKPAVGVDIIFFDAEDYGQPSQSMGQQQGDTWCLGSQYWGNNPPIENYQPEYGILLDMVGAKGATFPKEGASTYYAPAVVNKVWTIAARLGYSAYFIAQQTPGGITDDHVYVNKLTGIPSIDIVHYNPFLGDFGPFHHRHSDNLDIIDKATLKAVGQTVMEVVWRED